MKGVHTITDGNDSSILVGIKNNFEIKPSNFILKQNYPNPFTPALLLITRYKQQVLQNQKVLIYRTEI